MPFISFAFSPKLHLESEDWKIGLAVGLSLGLALVIAAVIVALLCRRRAKASKTPTILDSDM